MGSQREGVRDPFLDLEPPPKPRQERDWLTLEEFRLLLDAAGRPERNLPGLAERDQLTLLALVTTGLRRSELCALEWRDLELDGRKRSLLVRHGKGGKSRRQPLPARLAHELLKLRDARQPAPTDPVFCGLAGGRLQETILADIIRRAAKRAGIEKHVTAHTLRHTAATWLRQECGDTRLVAEYLGHADPLDCRALRARRSRRHSLPRRAGWRSWPSPETNRRRAQTASRRTTLRRISPRRQATNPTTLRRSRGGRVVVDVVAEGAAAVER